MFKRKKNEKGEELENAFDVFMRNYKTVPGFRTLVKLGGYLLMIVIILVLASNVDFDSTTATKDDKTTTTTTAVAKKLTYGEILDKMTTIGTSIYISVVVNESNYVVEETVNKDNVSGYLDTVNGIKKFKVQNNNIYELTLNNETLNNTFFESLDKDFIIPANLVTYLKQNTSIKTLEGESIIYTYNVTKNTINYEIKVHVSEEKCYKVEINSDTSNYLLTIK